MVRTMGTAGEGSKKKKKSTHRAATSAAQPGTSAFDVLVELQPSFRDRHIVREATINIEDFVAIADCKFAIEYINACGQDSIWTPATASFNPHYVALFWQEVELVGPNLRLRLLNKDILITERFLAEVMHCPTDKPDTCLLEYSSDRRIREDVTQISADIAGGHLNPKDQVTKGSLNKPLWFLDAVIAATIFTNCHSSERTGEYLCVLHDAHLGRWFSAPHLVLAALRKACRAIRTEKTKKTELHFPFLIMGIFQHGGIEVEGIEPVDSVPRYFTKENWRGQFKMRLQAAKKLIATKKRKTNDTEPTEEQAEPEDDDDDQETATEVPAQPYYSYETIYAEQVAIRQDITGLRQDFTQMQQSNFQTHQLTCYTSQLMEALCLGQQPDPDLLTAIRLSREQPYGGHQYPFAPPAHDGAGPSVSRGTFTEEQAVDEEDEDMD